MARQAVDDFRRANSAYPMDVAFAVKYEDDYELGCKVLGVTPDENRPTPYRRYPIVRFHRPEEENGYLSNWYMRDFTIDGITYCCVEQYMKSIPRGAHALARKPGFQNGSGLFSSHPARQTSAA